jgi:homospermidine synthase
MEVKCQEQTNTAGARDIRQEGAKGSRGFIISFSRQFYSSNLLHMDESCAAEMIDAVVETFKRRVNDFHSYTTNIYLF